MDWQGTAAQGSASQCSAVQSNAGSPACWIAQVAFTRKRMTHHELNEWLAARTTEDGECLIWARAVNSSGHPVAFLDGKQANSVRRVVARVFGKRLMAEQVVTMTCGQQLCLNHEHMACTSRSRAMQKAWTRGTFNRVGHRIKVTQAAQDRSKLTMEAARDIRLRCANGESKSALAREYKVWPSTVYAIVNHQRWADTGGFFDQLMGK